MTGTSPTHPRMTLQVIGGSTSSGSPMASGIGCALRPCPPRLSAPRGHAGQAPII